MTTRRIGSARRRSAASWIAATAVVAVPLAMDPSGYFIFLPLKWTLATVTVAAAIAALVLERRPLARGATSVAWLVLLGVVMAATVLGVGGLTSWIGYPGRYLGMLAWVVFFGAFVVGASLAQPGERERIVSAAAMGSLVVSMYALLQELDVDPIEWEASLDLDRARSTLGNAAFLGAYLAMIIPITARLALDAAAALRLRVLHATCALLGTVALLATETRGAWLGVLGGGAVVLVLDRRRLRALSRRTRATIACGVTIAVVLLATVSPYAARVRSITDPSEATGHGRLLQWERTLDLIGDRPLLGWGPDTYALRFPAYIDAEFERDVERVVVPDRAHNLVLDLAATTGSLGTIAYLSVLVLVALAVARARDPDPISVALAGGCAAYVVQLQFSFSVPDLDAIFWLFVGLLVSVTVPHFVAPRRHWAVIPALVAGIVAVWGGMETVADRTLRDALEAEADGDFERAQHTVDLATERAPLRAQYLQGAGRLHLRVAELTGRRRDYERALDAVDEARDLVPDDIELAIDRGDLLLSWGEQELDQRRINQAAVQYLDVLELDPNSSRVHLTLGVAYVQLGRTEEAEYEWLTAAALAPDAPGPLLNLGRLYVEQDRDDDARRVLRAALDLDPDDETARHLLEGLDA